MTKYKNNSQYTIRLEPKTEGVYEFVKPGETIELSDNNRYLDIFSCLEPIVEHKQKPTPKAPGGPVEVKVEKQEVLQTRKDKTIQEEANKINKASK